jgi:hypothetical protein
MRRPDAKLADAVVDRRTSVETQTAPSTLVKRDADGEVAWKPVSAVSGQAGEEEAEVGSPLRQKVDRRDQESKTSPATGPPEERSTTSKAISALINETSTAKRKASASQPLTKPASEPTTTKIQDQQLPSKDTIAVKQEPKESDNLAIFDFTDSSPIDTTNNPRPRIPDVAKASRTARRHSAMPATTDRENSSKLEKEKEKPEGALPSVHKRTGSGNVKSSSSSSSSSSTSLSRSISSGSATLSANFAKSTSSSARNSSAAVSKEKEKKSAAVASSSDARAKEDAKDRETSSLRAERAASRRKSMML